jgi:hypothetical protein
VRWDDIMEKGNTKQNKKKTIEIENITGYYVTSD